MFKISSVSIKNFWGRLNLNAEFNDEVNIIIGKNGSGKTTFMNILHGALAVDIKSLSENEFSEVKISLMKSGGETMQINVTRVHQVDFAYPVVEYDISGEKRKLRLFGADERRGLFYSRRQFQEDTFELRKLLDSLVPITSLSVYRMRNDDDYEVRDKHGIKILSPVDYRLEQALKGLATYQLELNQMARKISSELQSQVLASILYSETDAAENGYDLNFDKEQERKKLLSAYKQLNAYDLDINQKINFHVTAIDGAIKQVKKISTETMSMGIDLKSLEALRKTRKIIELSLKASGKSNEIFKRNEIFLSSLKNFIVDKNFSFDSGALKIENKHGVIECTRLSSGEKQLIILLVEALLQNGKPHVFLADEPELSLHIAWQKMVIPEVKRINPGAQIIAATHSPEVASKYPTSIIDIEKLISD